MSIQDLEEGNFENSESNLIHFRYILYMMSNYLLTYLYEANYFVDYQYRLSRRNELILLSTDNAKLDIGSIHSTKQFFFMILNATLRMY